MEKRGSYHFGERYEEELKSFSETKNQYREQLNLFTTDVIKPTKPEDIASIIVKKIGDAGIGFLTALLNLAYIINRNPPAYNLIQGDKQQC